MESSSQGGDREITPPFLLRLFYKTGSFYRSDEFAISSLPPHISIYTWSSCSLNDLALELAASKPAALPSPAAGTRLVFQLVCPDLRSTGAFGNAQPRFMVKDMGSVVIGEGGPGAEPFSGTENALPPPRRDADKSKTLSDSKFVVGDYVSCAVLPPLRDGSVAPQASVRRDSTFGMRDNRSGPRGGFLGREDGFGRGGGRGGRGAWRDSVERLPAGEWRRGERLPDDGPGRPRGRGRW